MKKYLVKFYGTPEIRIEILAYNSTDAKIKAEKIYPHLRFAGVKELR